MKKILFLLAVVVLTSCSDPLDDAKIELKGCWELISVKGKAPNFIHYVKYDDSEVIAYYGSDTPNGPLLSEDTIRFDLKLDKNEKVLITNYGEEKTVVCQLVIKEKDILEITVLKSKTKWLFKRISEKKLKSIVDSATIQ